MKESRGFTLIEMVVVLAVIAILAAILTPIVTSYIERARVNTATNDVKKIAAAIVQFNTDTKVWPIYKTTSFASDANAINGDVYAADSTTGNEGVAASSGGGNDWSTVVGTSAGDLHHIINENGMGLGVSGPRAWKGAYSEFGEDPWGTKYYLNAKFLKPGVNSSHQVGGNNVLAAVYVISAGPNQTLETNYDQPTSAFNAGGDDIVARIR